MTIDKGNNILPFSRSTARGEVAVLPAKLGNKLPDAATYALVLRFPLPPRVASVIQFPKSGYRDCVKIPTVMPSEPVTSLRGIPDCDRRLIKQAAEFSRATADRLAIERGEDDGMTVGPQ